MYIQKGELLAIQPSASKPSLLSSYWSIHVQIQNSDRLDLDVKNCSQSSLPDAFDFKPIPLRNTKSMSDLTMDVSEAKVSLSREDSMIVDEVTTKQDNLTNRISEWLTRIEIQETK